MNSYQKDFIQFEQIIHPIVQTAAGSEISTKFGLDYRTLNKETNDYVMKFKIVSPLDTSRVVKIIHGYTFKVRNKSAINHNIELLAHFFAFLVSESLKKINESLEKGSIEIPSKKALFKAIFVHLISRYN